MKKRALVILFILVITAVMQFSVADNLCFTDCSFFIANKDTIISRIPINHLAISNSDENNQSENEKDWINFISLSDDMDTRFIIRNLDKNYKRVKLSIYNSWGKRVYQSDNYQNDFDARFYPEGTYYYQAYYMLNGVNEEICKNSFFDVKE